MIRAGVNEKYRADTSAEFQVPIPIYRAWESLQDFQAFASLDIFHHRIVMDRSSPGTGVGLIIEHRFACFAVRRVGRILRWREGAGWSFSDLSARGPQHGFPHVYTISLSPGGDGVCRVAVRVTGRWTARWLPRAVVRLWLVWIMSKTQNSVRNEFLRANCERERQKPNG